MRSTSPASELTKLLLSTEHISPMVSTEGGRRQEAEMLFLTLSKMRKKHRKPESLVSGHPVYHMHSWEDPQPLLSLSREIITRTATSIPAHSEEL